MHDPTSSPQFCPVVAGHWIMIRGEQIVHTQSIAAMLTARTMEIAALAQMQSHMGAPLQGPEENQVADLQKVHNVRAYRHRQTETFLKVSIPRQPDARLGKGALNQTGTIVIRPYRSSPSVTVLFG
jgi:hypothetical protein